MISKISFSKLVRDEMRKLNWLLAVQLLVFGLLIPFRILVVMAVKRPDLFMEKADRLRIFRENIGLGHTENTVFILAAGIICAVCAFSYVHSSVKLDFLHSLPLKRERLFAAKYLSSVLTFVTAYLASQALALVIGAVYGVCSFSVVLEVAAASLEGILCFLCSYSGALLAVMLTGKMLTTILTMGVIAGYIPFIWLLVVSFQDVFYITSITNRNSAEGSELLACSSPWAFALSGYRGTGTARYGQTGPWPEAAQLCQLLAVAAVFTLAALLIYRVRQTETAGKAIAFPKMEGAVKLLLTVPSALLAAMVAHTSFISPFWELFFIFFFGVLGCVIMEFIYRWDIRLVLSHKSHMAVTVAAAAAIFFAVRFDVTGYNSYLPKQDEIAAMAVDESYFLLDGSEESEEGNFPNQKRLDSLETENFAPIYEMAVNGISNVGEEDWEKQVAYAEFKYRLKDGKEIYRRYWVDQDVFDEQMEKLQQDETFHELYYPILTWEDTDFIDHMEFTSTGMEIEASETADVEEAASYADYILVMGEDIDRVVSAYREDLKALSYTQLAAGEGGGSLAVWGKSDSGVDYYPVTAECENTIEVLRQIHEKQGG